jgi:hypothetical protein
VTRRNAPFDRTCKIGLKLPGVVVGTAWGGRALKVNGQLLACMATNKQAEPNTLVVRVDFLDRDLRIANEPDVYYLKPHYVNYPCVLARLERIGDDALRELLESGCTYVRGKSKRRSASSVKPKAAGGPGL